MRQFRRSDRLSEQILRDVSTLVPQEWGTSVATFINFTRARMSADLKYVTIYWSILGDETKRAEAVSFLENQNKRIRHLLAGQLRLRMLPELIFKFDPSVEESIRLEKLFNEIRSTSRK